MAKTSTSIEIKAPLKKVYEVITDFESYPDFLSGSKGAKIIKKSGNNLQAEFKVDVIKTITYILDIKLSPAKGFSWSLVKGDFMKGNTGSWKLEEKKKGTTHASYEIEVDFGLLVPKAISSMLVGTNLPTMMREFKERAEE
jgi:ribosome-associated toxin RatA of RatAB toxin-antitoxin module